VAAHGGGALINEEMADRLRYLDDQRWLDVETSVIPPDVLDQMKSAKNFDIAA